jgi:hypothetical protein
VLGAARPDAGGAGGMNGGIGAAAGRVPSGIRGGALAGGADCAGRCAGTPSGAVGTVAAPGGTKGFGGPAAGDAAPPRIGA